VPLPGYFYSLVHSGWYFLLFVHAEGINLLPYIVCYLQSGFELTKTTDTQVTFKSPVKTHYKPAANWIISAAADNGGILFFGDSNGQLTLLNFMAVVKQKKV